MNTIAFDNITLLLNEEYKTKYLISNNNKLELVDKNNQELCLKDLEYPIYFTYNHILNEISENGDIAYLTKKRLLRMIDLSMDSLYNYINDYNDDNSNMHLLLEDIDKRYDNIRSKTLVNYCENIIYLFDEIVDRFREAGKYLYFHREYSVLFSDDEDYNDTDTDEDLSCDDEYTDTDETVDGDCDDEESDDTDEECDDNDEDNEDENVDDSEYTILKKITSMFVTEEVNPETLEENPNLIYDENKKEV